MAFPQFVPLLSFLVASLLTIASLKLHKRKRILSLAPICMLSILSLATTYKLSWPVGADSTFASLVVFYIPYSIKLLALDEHPMSPEISTHDWKFADYYRVWNNPRSLPVRLSYLDRSASCDKKSRAVFAVRRAMKAISLALFNGFVFQKMLVRSLGSITAADFSAEMELPALRHALRLSSHQIQVRAVISIQWIWSAYFFLEFGHCLLAIAFVTIGLDRPEEWPLLYGSPLDATSVRAFWGRFWHRITIPTYSHYAQLVSRIVLGLQPASRGEKTLIPLLIFAMSGVSHCLVGWSLGDAALSRDVLFFVLNFLVAAMETTISKAKMIEKKKFAPIPKTIKILLGLCWVFIFFFCVTPLWIYPKVHYALVELAS
ncbi:membrane bound O-acyl transferase family-domain-containing protein [Hypoxylon rubiginosum]|uniref:Membrane bound O-acyl transferase family-domain-containing protein n=1 Tax=Hypoxylon rubiginosum TaxID=110542 RepID=A0ACC0CNU5_9PEZI|nr:membrane bound O-acyl transferase family-domain-containing protein [Hypoxylon rubiginosum]